MLRTSRPSFGQLLLAIFLPIAALITAPAKAQPSLSLAVPSVAKGSAALTALGPSIGDIAQNYGLTAQKLTTLLQPTLHRLLQMRSQTRRPRNRLQVMPCRKSLRFGVPMG